MSKAIESFATIYNNPFIFVPLFAEFYRTYGPRPNGLLASYLVLPLTLHPTTRSYLKNARKTSTLHIMLSDRSRLFGLPERMERYREMTGTTLQHGFDSEQLTLGADLRVTAREIAPPDFCPPDSPKAARKLGKLLSPMDLVTVYRVFGVKKL